MPIYIPVSRSTVMHQLQERLMLREWRVANASQLNSAQRYGGLGGCVLEGPPGVGKSLILTNLLQMNGYEQRFLGTQSPPAASEKIFYMMPASMPLKQKKELLTKAFDEGAIVLADEINSSPMMEQFINALLMGTHPDRPSGHQNPVKPGFMIFGSQNPMAMAGRRAMSTALQRRLTTLSIAEYTYEELHDMLITYYKLPPIEAQLLYKTYQERYEHAARYHFKPAPCFRDLDKLAKQIQPNPAPLSRKSVHSTPEQNLTLSIDNRLSQPAVAEGLEEDDGRSDISGESYQAEEFDVLALTADIHDEEVFAATKGSIAALANTSSRRKKLVDTESDVDDSSPVPVAHPRPLIAQGDADGVASVPYSDNNQTFFTPAKNTPEQTLAQLKRCTLQTFP